MIEAPEISIVGAGAVGVSIAASLLHWRVTRRLALFDIAAEKAEGEALDLAHGAPFFGDARVSGFGMESLKAGELCILAAGAKQRVGESRLELLQRNAAVLVDIARRLKTNGLPRVVLVVSNPVDVMTELLRRVLEPEGVRVLGTGTFLDTMRLRHALSRRLALSPESVHVHVVGEHGDSSVSLLDAATAGGMPLHEAFRRRGLRLDEDVRAALAAEVRGAAHAIIRRKGATWPALGGVGARVAKAILRDERIVGPVSATVEPGLSAGVPCILHTNGADVLGYPPLSAREEEELGRSLGVLRDSLATLGHHSG